MNIYEARIRNCRRLWDKFRSLLSSGYIIVNEVGGIYTDPAWFVETDEGFFIHPFGSHAWALFLSKDLMYDDGLHTTIKDFNRQFAGWKAIHPKHIKPIFRGMKDD